MDKNIHKLKLQHYINHIAFVLDRSGSMNALTRDVERVFDNEISHLRTRSKELGQETRVSVYTFNDSTECLVFDMDVMRMPSIAQQLWAIGQTALLDAASTAITDMQSLPELYGDHAFLLYVLTDGEENRSTLRAASFNKLVTRLPENWTIACMVPSVQGLYEAKKFGFPTDNIQVWTTTSEGVQEVGRTTRAATETYMTLRSRGIRGTTSLYTNLTHLTQGEVKKTLQKLNPSLYTILRVSSRKDEVIKPFIESWLKKPYRIGQAYYELMKTEEVQRSKNVCIERLQDGNIYNGLHARSLLGLSDQTVRLKPGDHGEWRIYIQSTSVNRKLPRGTQVLVMK
jgi:hypothetical protein